MFMIHIVKYVIIFYTRFTDNKRLSSSVKYLFCGLFGVNCVLFIVNILKKLFCGKFT